MIEEPPVDIVAQLPPNVIVHDMSFDWTGRRLALACSNKTIKIYLKKNQEWVEQASIILQGASAWKVKWASPQFGTIIATCSLDTQIRIYELKRVERNEGAKNQWSMVHNIPQGRSIEDLKFVNSKNRGLQIAIATSDGYLKVFAADDIKNLKDWGWHHSILVNELGLSCLSWSKNLAKPQQLIMAIGCKSIQTSPKKVLNGMKIYSGNVLQESEIAENINLNTLVFVNFNRDAPKVLEKINTPKAIKQTKTINDVSWAILNGRSYYLLAIATDQYVKIFELSIKQANKDCPVIDVLKEIKLSDQPSMRISWNLMGTYLSASEKKKVRIWRCLSRGIWNQIKQIEA